MFIAKFDWNPISILTYLLRREWLLALLIIIPLSIYLSINYRIMASKLHRPETDLARYNEKAKISTTPMMNICNDVDSIVILIGIIPPGRHDSLFVSENHVDKSGKLSNLFFVIPKLPNVILKRENISARLYAVDVESSYLLSDFNRSMYSYVDGGYNRIRDSSNTFFATLDCKKKLSRSLELTYGRYNSAGTLLLMRTAFKIWRKSLMLNAKSNVKNMIYIKTLSEYLWWEDRIVSIQDADPYNVIEFLVFSFLIIAFFSPILYPCISKNKPKMGAICLSIAVLAYFFAFLPALIDSNYHPFVLMFSIFIVIVALWLICHVLWRIDTWRDNSASSR